MFTRLKNAIKRHFLTGLLVFVPIALTVFLVNWLDTALMAKISLLPPDYNPNTYFEGRVPGLGVLLTLAIIYVIGFVSSNYLGKIVVKVYERLLNQIPGVSWLYGVSKQFMDAIFKLLEELQGKGADKFRGVALVEYPRKGIYTLAFITGDSVAEIQEVTGKEVVNIFIPTTPNPTSGFFLMVPKEELVLLEMTVEQAFRLILSAGMVGGDAPKKQKERPAFEGRAVENAPV